MTLSPLGLRTVIYPSPDLEAAKVWFSALLGATPSYEDPFYVGFDVGGYELGLLAQADPADGALTYWGVKDLDAALAAAYAGGATEHAAAQDVGDGIRLASVRNPQGNVVGFIYNPNFVAH
jgi:predicted enzyme related to lactoylglutathione lyase